MLAGEQDGTDGVDSGPSILYMIWDGALIAVMLFIACRVREKKIEDGRGRRGIEEMTFKK